MKEEDETIMEGKTDEDFERRFKEEQERLQMQTNDDFTERRRTRQRRLTQNELAERIQFFQDILRRSGRNRRNTGFYRPGDDSMNNGTQY